MPSDMPPPLPPAPRGPGETRLDPAASGGVEEKPSRLALASVVLGVLSCLSVILTRWGKSAQVAEAQPALS